MLLWKNRRMARSGSATITQLISSRRRKLLRKKSSFNLFHTFLPQIRLYRSFLGPRAFLLPKPTLLQSFSAQTPSQSPYRLSFRSSVNMQRHLSLCSRYSVWPSGALTSTGTIRFSHCSCSSCSNVPSCGSASVPCRSSEP